MRTDREDAAELLKGEAELIEMYLEGEPVDGRVGIRVHTLQRWQRSMLRSAELLTEQEQQT